jgi:hypothetical protein
VRADGHYHWEGLVEVKPGSNALDVVLEKGQEASGGCCYYGGVAYDKASPETMPVMVSSAPAPMPARAGSAASGSGGGGDSGGYRQVDSGLGAYDPAHRPAPGAITADGPAATGESNGGKSAPAPALAVIGAVLMVAVALRRKR